LNTPGTPSAIATTFDGYPMTQQGRHNEALGLALFASCIGTLAGYILLFLLIERIKGSPVSARVLNYSQILGLVFVLALMVFVTYNDILRLL
ncbi:MAG: tripartite tricarboxylate transporter permease, partial [Planctomycetota bacterium]